MKFIKFVILPIVIICTGCMQYHSPARHTWSQYLRGASFTDMTETARIAKRPVFLGSGGKLITSIDSPATAEYGDKVQNDTAISVNYMANLEYELYDALRKPGISVRAGFNADVRCAPPPVAFPVLADIIGAVRHLVQIRNLHQ